MAKKTIEKAIDWAGYKHTEMRKNCFDYKKHARLECSAMGKSPFVWPSVFVELWKE